jgi:putative endonuclease
VQLASITTALTKFLITGYKEADARNHFRSKLSDAGWTAWLFTFPCMSAARQLMGRKGERVAERWLRVHGWEIAEQRFRNGRGAIDLVAIRAEREGSGRTVAFVEVKTRASDDFRGPVSAVNWRKQRELSRSAKVWMSRFEKPGDTFRFDVIGVILEAEKVRVQHVENAFLLRGTS